AGSGRPAHRPQRGTGDNVRIAVELFAAARQAAGCARVQIELSQGATLGELRRRMIEQFPALAPLLAHASFAVDAQYAADDATREFTAGRQTRSLDYECYPRMAGAKLQELEATARARWDLVDCAIVHRLGAVAIGETSVAIAVSAAHREAAFAAAQWLIDTLKE